MKTKTHILVALVLATSAIVSVSRADKKSPSGKVAPRENLTGRDLDMAQKVVVKHFLVAMRRSNLDEIQKAIAPEYLEDLKLGEDTNVPVDIAPVLGIHNIIPASDGTSVLCLYTTQDGAKEAMLLQTVQEGGRVYVLPSTLPNAETGNFEPWTLRINVDKFADL